MRGLFLVLSAALLAFATVAKAEPEKLDIAEDTDWSHQWTAMKFPAKWGDFTREAIYQFEDRETNLSAKYWDADRNTLVRLYLYRPGLADASIWHDRALVALGANQAFGSEHVKGTRTASFTPNGAQTESGILTIIAAEGEFRSTSVALFSAGDWLIKLRVSSRSLDPDGLEAMVRRLLQLLPRMEGYSDRASYVMEACLDEIEYQNADRLSFGNAASSDDASQKALFDPKDMLDHLNTASRPSVDYCRDGDGGLQGSIYRPIGAKDRYLIAFGDSGASVEAAPAVSLDKVLATGDEDRVSNAYFLVSLSTGDKVRIFMPFLSLPQPNQAAKTMMQEPPMSTIQRRFGDQAPKVLSAAESDAAASEKAN